MIFARLGEFAHGYAWWITEEGRILARGWHEDNKVARQQLREAVESLDATVLHSSDRMESNALSVDKVN